MKSFATIKTLAASIALAAAIAAPVALAPATTAQAMTPYDVTYAETNPRAHYEGEKVTIGDTWGQPVYAEWHRGASGRWWATFWTYNYTKVWATPAPAGSGWAFFVYDAHGDFVPVYRCEESSNYGVYGPEGVSSHWQDNNGHWY